MEEAVRRLERGEPPTSSRRRRSTGSTRRWKRSRRPATPTEEELAREQLARVADVLKRLKERHDRLVAEADRLQQEAQEGKGWGRGLRISLLELAESEKGSARRRRPWPSANWRTRRSSPGSCARRRGDEAGRRGICTSLRPPRRRTGGDGVAGRGRAPAAAAARLLQSLLDALKMEDGGATRPNQGANRRRRAAGLRPAGDGIPPLAQLKLSAGDAGRGQASGPPSSRASTPTPRNWTDEQKKELDALHREQKAVADLIEEYAGPVGDEGEEK